LGLLRGRRPRLAARRRFAAADAHRRGAIRRALIDAGHIVITVGGGGIPVVADEHGHLRGIAAVIDKDFASSLLATRLGADTFIISTAVEKVALNFGKPEQRGSTA
jgi:carbamate kinase